MHAAADVVIDPVVGEEALSGSTRLKAGTAQKMVLNLLSTGVMVRLGRTYGNLMTGVATTNEKLRERAVRLVETVTGGTREAAAAALTAASFDVRTACVMLKKGVAAAEARTLLAAAAGSLRAVIG
jgi:N-acetylmuramic acid 6-phosphate etherase